MVKIILSVIEVLACIFLIGTVLLQQGQDQGLSGAISGGSADTFFGKHKSRGMDAMLHKATIVVAVAFVVLALVMNCL